MTIMSTPLKDPLRTIINCRGSRTKMKKRSWKAGRRTLHLRSSKRLLTKPILRKIQGMISFTQVVVTTKMTISARKASRVRRQRASCSLTVRMPPKSTLTATGNRQPPVKQKRNIESRCSGTGLENILRNFNSKLDSRRWLKTKTRASMMNLKMVTKTMTATTISHPCLGT